MSLPHNLISHNITKTIIQNNTNLMFWKSNIYFMKMTSPKLLVGRWWNLIKLVCPPLQQQVISLETLSLKLNRLNHVSRVTCHVSWILVKTGVGVGDTWEMFCLKHFSFLPGFHWSFIDQSVSDKLSSIKRVEYKIRLRWWPAIPSHHCTLALLMDVYVLIILRLHMLRYFFEIWNDR